MSDSKSIPLSYLKCDDDCVVLQFNYDINSQNTKSQSNKFVRKENGWSKGNTQSTISPENLRTEILKRYPFIDAKEIVKKADKSSRSVYFAHNKIELLDHHDDPVDSINELALVDRVVYQERGNSIHFVFIGKTVLVEARDVPKDVFSHILKGTQSYLESSIKQINLNGDDGYKDIPSNSIEVLRNGTTYFPLDIEKIAAYLMRMEGDYSCSILILESVKKIRSIIQEAMTNGEHHSFERLEINKQFTIVHYGPTIQKKKILNCAKDGLFYDYEALKKSILSESNRAEELANKTSNEVGTVQDVASVVNPNDNQVQNTPACQYPTNRVKPDQNKYIINFKKNDTTEGVFPEAQFNKQGGRGVEQEVENAFTSCKSLSSFVSTLESIFELDHTSVIDELFPYIQLPGMSIHLTPLEKDRWKIEIKGTKKADLDRIELEQKDFQKKLNQQQEELRSLMETNKVKLSILERVLTLCNVDDYNMLEDRIRENLDNLAALGGEAENLRKVVHLLHATPEKAREKAEYLSQALAPGSSLKDTSLDELKNQIAEIAKSYKKTGELSSELESFYQQPDSLLLGTFPLIKEEVGSKYSYFTDSYNKLSSQMIIAEAIKSKLADPQLRSKLDLEINALNEELRQYSLAIEVPQRGTSADPSRHKFVGYDSGGTRGQISSVSAWGLVELENGSYKRTIYKSEVRIYQ
jgi:hypothetical protein